MKGAIYRCPPGCRIPPRCDAARPFRSPPRLPAPRARAGPSSFNTPSFTSLKGKRHAHPSLVEGLQVDHPGHMQRAVVQLRVVTRAAEDITIAPVPRAEARAWLLSRLPRVPRISRKECKPGPAFAIQPAWSRRSGTMTVSAPGCGRSHSPAWAAAADPRGGKQHQQEEKFVFHTAAASTVRLRNTMRVAI